MKYYHSILRTLKTSHDHDKGGKLIQFQKWFQPIVPY